MSLMLNLLFLNEELLEKFYVTQPKGFVISGKVDKVYRLKKTLYGLKQAPKAWYSKIDAHFCSNEFVRSNNEPILYLNRQGTDFLKLCLYVDDIIYIRSSCALIGDLKAIMMKKFEMKDLGALHYFLGLEVMQKDDGIFVSQMKYATDLLKMFNMLNCKVVATPMNLNEKLQAEDSTDITDAKYFRSLIGGLIYLSHTRPDIAFSISVVSRFMQNPTKHHLRVAK